jgi:hypothetical protein
MLVSNSIAQWAEGYEDGGPLVEERHVQSHVLRRFSYRWVAASKGPITVSSRAGVEEGIYHYHGARDVYAHAKGYSTYEELEMKRRPESLGIWKVMPGQHVLPQRIWTTL